MDLSTLLLILLAGIAAAAVAVWLRRGGESGDDEIVAELRRELEVQRREAERHREESLHEAVRSTVALASEQLGMHAKATTEQLDSRNSAVSTKLSEMGAELDRVRRLITEFDSQRAVGQAEMAARLEAAGKATSELSQTTDALRQALASPQARGQWGERMAEDVLRMAGFVHGVNYLTQRSQKGGGRPDFTFLLPAERRVHMDVKFPLDNYLRHLEAETDAEREAAKKAFLKDAKQRITELSDREYIDTSDGTLDQVLLFLPNEHLYGFIHQADPTIIDTALKHKVVLCSPLTLFAVLAVIRQSVDDHLGVERSAEILDALAGFTKEWEKFSGQIEKLGRGLGSAQRAFDEVNTTRRRQLDRQLDRIEDLRNAAVEPEGEVLSLPDRSSDAAAG